MTAPANFHKWEVDLLKRLDAPVTKANLAFLNAWARREGAGGENNPFNSKLKLPGSTDVPGTGQPAVQNYSSPADGAQATYNTLNSSLYADIIGALRSGHPSLTHNYIGLHNWSAGPSGSPSTGYYNLKGISTAPPNTIGVQAPAKTGAGGASGCQHHVSVKVSIVPLGSICLDKPLALIAMTGGGVLILAGVAVLVVGLARTTGAGKVATDALAVIPVARAAKLGKAATPAARTAKRETAQATATRRRAPVEAERRREETHTARQARLNETQRTRTAAAASAETRRRTEHRRRGRIASAEVQYRKAKAGAAARPPRQQRVYLTEDDREYTRARRSATERDPMTIGRR